MMMKKLIVLLTVLAMATVSNAALKISVNGAIDPPDTTVTLLISDWATIDVYSNGDATSMEGPYFMKIAGPGRLDITQATNALNPPGYPDSIFIWEWDPHVGEVFMDLAQPIVRLYRSRREHR